MKKYRVLRDCTWKHGYWDEGQVVSFEDNEKPPEHFQLVDKNGEDVVAVDDGFKPHPATMSEINKARQSNAPKTGMGYTKPKAGEPKQETI